MGASNSHEYDYERAASPHSDSGSRVLTIDPRSPTVDITRTPIVVDKTPEGALSGPVDPRSPTVGIVRTPLTHVQPLKKDEEEPELFADIDAGLNLSNTSETSETSQTSNDALFSEVQTLSLDDLPISESTRLVFLEETENLKVTETEKAKKKKKTSQPKELFPAKKQTSALKDSTRSPLSSRNIDMNSPLHIVQRRQMKDIDIKRTCAQENTSSRFIVKDKENM